MPAGRYCPCGWSPLAGDRPLKGPSRSRPRPLQVVSRPYRGAGRGPARLPPLLAAFAAKMQQECIEQFYAIHSHHTQFKTNLSHENLGSDTTIGKPQREHRRSYIPVFSDPDGEDEGGPASSSLAVSTRWISAAKLLQYDLATLAQRKGGESEVVAKAAAYQPCTPLLFIESHKKTLWLMP
ncbi:hypothetical protein GW17_00042068 [Ensete ventricosum]|nr:hypothetical protein GW17_00042068 [Ensete ventricosum]